MIFNRYFSTTQKLLGLVLSASLLAACGTPPSSSSSSSSVSSSSSSSSSVVSSVASSSSSSVASNNSVPAITVQGNRVLFGGQWDSIAGPSLFWSNTGWGSERFYNADLVGYVKNNWNAKLIRAAIGVDPTQTNAFGQQVGTGAYLDNTNGNTQVQRQMLTTVIDAAIANDMYVIIDWHTHHAEDFTSQAITFFSEISAQYGQFNNVIYEVYNEPLNVSWSGVIKPYAEQVIQAIRANDPDNLIIVGTPNWSQDVDKAAQDPITRFQNIAYTLHFYANTHLARETNAQGDVYDGYIMQKAKAAVNAGLPLFVTEWGTVSADGDGQANQEQTRLWMDFLRANNISHANWAMNDKVEGASILVPNANAGGNWQDSDLTQSGRLVRDIIRSW